ncbi:NC2B [Hepatospora eriocheir]|uniref:NC2B n=1 Tax=Hepatospora eriocheir TaxID=1081669 RepID=A0A1X0QL65_9MICR|nr:NC2B [Hepatospora eriocheir]
MTFEKHEDENSLPRTTVEKIAQETLPTKCAIQKEAKVLLKDASTTFLMNLTLEAFKIQEKDKKKTLSADHICQALSKINFGEYESECRQSLEDYMEYSKLKPSKQNKLKDSGLSLDVLHEQQLELFEKAKVETKDGFNPNDQDFDREDIKIDNVEEIIENSKTDLKDNRLSSNEKELELFEKSKVETNNEFNSIDKDVGICINDMKEVNKDK